MSRRRNEGLGIGRRSRACGRKSLRNFRRATGETRRRAGALAGCGMDDQSSFNFVLHERSSIAPGTSRAS
jgi:hypothetical protein